MNRLWSNSLRAQMENHQEPLPDGLWERIEQAMEMECPASQISKRRRAIWSWKHAGAVAAAMILALLTGNDMVSNHGQSHRVAAYQLAAKSQGSRSAEVLVQKEATPPASSPKPQPATPQRPTTSSYTANNATDTTSQAAHKQPVTTDINTKQADSMLAQEAATASPTAEKEKPQNPQTAQPSGPKVYYAYQNLPVEPKKAKAKSWTAGVYASNITSNSRSKHDGYGVLASQDISGKPINDSEAFREIYLSNYNKQVNTSVKHRQPVTLGAAISYNLTNRWQASAGLNYIKLSSTLTSGSKSSYYSNKQIFHNLGLSANISYAAFKFGSTSVYVTASCLAEKNISGTSSTEYFIDSKLKSTKSKKVEMENLQWSLNSALGVQHNIFRKLGVYAEAGASYYFDNGSEFVTIYKEKPTNLSLRFGLRLNLNE